MSATNGVRLGMESAHVLDKAARDRGRQFYWVIIRGHVPDIAINAAKREFCAPVLIVAQHVSVSLEPRAAARTSALYKPSKSRRSEGRAAF